jgi:hypothetical protein
MPAVTGPSRTNAHSSGEKAAFVVIAAPLLRWAHISPERLTTVTKDRGQAPTQGRDYANRPDDRHLGEHVKQADVRHPAAVAAVDDELRPRSRPPPRRPNNREPATATEVVALLDIDPSTALAPKDAAADDRQLEPRARGASGQVPLMGTTPLGNR